MDAAESKIGPTLLVFSDDWGRHPSSCQHLIRRLLPDYHVTWVNTIGMRRPSLDVATVWRGFEKMRHWSRPATKRSLPSNLEVVSPTMWPWFSRTHDRRLNQWLLSRQLMPLTKGAVHATIAITTIPIVADLVGVLPVAHWVYYCVDDFTVWPGLDQTALRTMEADLVERCDRIIAVSETLQQKLHEMGRASNLLTHGVDLEFWNGVHQQADKPLPDYFSKYGGPFIVFWGVLDQRMDPGFIQTLSNNLDQGTILLIGPQQNLESSIQNMDRVVVCPPVPFEQLPAIGAAADVLIMPYRDIAVTRAIQPLKLKEYLAVGKPVVVRDLPSTRPWAHCLDVASSDEEFSRLVHARLYEGVPDSQREARSCLLEESWAAKAEQFKKWAIL